MTEITWTLAVVLGLNLGLFCLYAISTSDKIATLSSKVRAANFSIKQNAASINTVNKNSIITCHEILTAMHHTIPEFNYPNHFMTSDELITIMTNSNEEDAFETFINGLNLEGLFDDSKS